MTIEISQFENEFRLNSQLLLPKRVDELFPFFSKASNLEELTPATLKFSIATSGELEMSEGTVIDYNLRVNGVPFRWKSLISVWDPPNLFVDEQLRGPYRYWIHRHSFEARGANTLVSDYVRYQVFGGNLVHNLFVKRELTKIFSFRHQKLLELFS